MESMKRRDVGLVSGLITVAQALKKHAHDGFTTNRASPAPLSLDRSDVRSPRVNNPKTHRTDQPSPRARRYPRSNIH